MSYELDIHYTRYTPSDNLHVKRRIVQGTDCFTRNHTSMEHENRTDKGKGQAQIISFFLLVQAAWLGDGLALALDQGNCLYFFFLQSTLFSIR
jgi:hypothetical protein